MYKRACTERGETAQCGGAEDFSLGRSRIFVGAGKNIKKSEKINNVREPGAINYAYSPGRPSGRL